MYRVRLLLIVFVATFFVACGDSSSPSLDEDVVKVDTIDGAMASKLTNPYQSLVETSLSHRVKAYRLLKS